MAIRAALRLSQYAECYCGVSEAVPPSVGLSAGWRELGDGRVQCPDCSHADKPALIPAKAAKAGHHGCRIYSSAVGADAVVLRIHAGANPIAGAELDRPVHFLARSADLDELISHLAAVRASLTQGNAQA